MRARLLIDAELALWALAAPARLSREVREQLDAAEVYVSAASILEIGLNAAEGQLAAEVLGALEPTGFRTLAVTAEHAALAAALAGAFRDPFDRLLVAQASAEGMTLLTTDAALAAMPAPPANAAARTRAAKGREPAGRRGCLRSARSSRRPRLEPQPARCRITLATAATPRRRARG